MAKGMAQDMANNMALDQAGQMAQGVMMDLDGDGEFINVMPPPNQMHQMMGVAHHHAVNMAGQVAFEAGKDMLLGFVKDGLIGVDMLPEGMELPEGFNLLIIQEYCQCQEVRVCKFWYYASDAKYASDA